MSISGNTCVCVTRNYAIFQQYDRNGVVKSREVRTIKGGGEGGGKKKKKKRNAHAKKDI